MTWPIFIKCASWLLIQIKAPIQMACAGTTGQVVDVSRCDGYLVVGVEVLPLWQAKEQP